MALDMYLLKYVFLGADSESMEVAGLVDLQVQGDKLKLTGSQIYDMNVLVGKWHAFYPLHAWFLSNGMADDGETLFISHEKLLELRTLCEKALQNWDMKIFRDACGPVSDEDFFGTPRRGDLNFFQGIERTLEFLQNLDTTRQHFYEFSR